LQAYRNQFVETHVIDLEQSGRGHSEPTEDIMIELQRTEEECKTLEQREKDKESLAKELNEAMNDADTTTNPPVEDDTIEIIFSEEKSKPKSDKKNNTIKMSYRALQQLCKVHNLSAKGTKSDLTRKLKENGFM